jgi:hypothetical protein
MRQGTFAFNVPSDAGRATSQASARLIEPTGGLRARLLRFGRERGARGFTDSEAQAALAMDPSTNLSGAGSPQRPRRVEFQRAGLIRDSGLTRPTPSGRAAVVWVAAEYTCQTE